MENQIQKKQTKGKVVVSRVFVSPYQKSNTITAELKQEVKGKTIYPDKTIRDNLQGNIYDIKEFEQSPKSYDSSRTDVTWIDIPEGTNMKDVEDRLTKYPNSTLYRVLSNYPIMSDNTEKYYSSLIEEGEEALAEQLRNRIANSQVIKYGFDAENGGYNKGDLILDKYGKPQYKACFLDETGIKQDVDYRTEDSDKFFATIEITMAMTGLTFNIAGQQV